MEDEELLTSLNDILELDNEMGNDKGIADSSSGNVSTMLQNKTEVLAHSSSGISPCGTSESRCTSLQKSARDLSSSLIQTSANKPQSPPASSRATLLHSQAHPTHSPTHQSPSLAKMLPQSKSPQTCKPAINSSPSQSVTSVRPVPHQTFSVPSDLHLFRSVSQQTLKKKPSAQDIEHVELESHSKLPICHWKSSVNKLDDIIDNSVYVKMDEINESRLKSLANECWTTIGVVVRASEPKLSKKGNKFLIWNLCSMTTQDPHELTLMLFSEAECFWRVQPGTAVVLISPELLPPRSGTDNGCTLSVKSSDQVEEIGICAIFGHCIATKADGTKCSMWVNKKFSSYCKYHSGEEVKSLQRQINMLSHAKIAQPVKLTKPQTTQLTAPSLRSALPTNWRAATPLSREDAAKKRAIEIIKRQQKQKEEREALEKKKDEERKKKNALESERFRMIVASKSHDSGLSKAQTCPQKEGQSLHCTASPDKVPAKQSFPISLSPLTKVKEVPSAFQGVKKGNASPPLSTLASSSQKEGIVFHPSVALAERHGANAQTTIHVVKQVDARKFTKSAENRRVPPSISAKAKQGIFSPEELKKLQAAKPIYANAQSTADTLNAKSIELIFKQAERYANEDKIFDMKVNAFYCETCKSYSSYIREPCRLRGHSIRPVAGVRVSWFRCRECGTKYELFSTEDTACQRCGNTFFDRISLGDFRKFGIGK